MFNVLVVIVVIVLVQDTCVFVTAQTYCSVRTGDSSSGYWDTAFGSEKSDAICKTSTCLNAADYKADMPFCAEEVTYVKFCPRSFDGKQLNTTSAIGLIIKSLDNHAKKCHEEATFKEVDSTGDCKKPAAGDCVGSKPIRRSPENEKTCHSNIKQGACYIAFPRCDEIQHSPVGVCTSFCMHERQTCRGENTFTGDSASISRGCSEDPWVANAGYPTHKGSPGKEFGPWAVNEEDSTNICTGAGIDKGGNISIIAILLSSWFIVLTLARVY